MIYSGPTLRTSEPTPEPISEPTSESSPPAQQETIVAIATAVVPQQGSVGIVRVSGIDAMAIARALFDAPGQQPWESHRILYGFVRHPQTAATVDEALLLLMYGPRSYTREDVVEFHCHGGIMAVQQVLQLCVAQGARLAEPGEFTLRAFLNGRLDLTQAEGIVDLVGARSPQAAQMALAGVQGKLATAILQVRATCVDILAEVEARVDFADDLPPLDEAAIQGQLGEVFGQVNQLLETAHQGELLRTGIKVAIVGRPNVGKSSLLNAWSRSDRAIVTNLPGTTRDVVESQLVVGGIPVQVLDTAGIRDASNPVEQLGIERSRAAAQAADLVLLVLDAQAGWTPADAQLYAQVTDAQVPNAQMPNAQIPDAQIPETGSGSALILVVNKVDLLTQATPEKATIELPPVLTAPVVYTAAPQQQGIAALETALLNQLHRGDVQAANLDWAINQRQAAALTRAQTALSQVQQTVAADLPLDFWTIDLRSAIQALGEITGEALTESMLGQIFSRFCIGK